MPILHRKWETLCRKLERLERVPIQKRRPGFGVFEVETKTRPKPAYPILSREQLEIWYKEFHLPEQTRAPEESSDDEVEFICHTAKSHAGPPSNLTSNTRSSATCDTGAVHRAQQPSGSTQIDAAGPLTVVISQGQHETTTTRRRRRRRRRPGPR